MDTKRDWASLKASLKNSADLSEIILKLEKRDVLNGWQISILNLLFMDEQAEENKGYFDSTFRLNERMAGFSEGLVKWTRRLTLLTGVLAGAAILNFVALLLCR